MARSCYFQHLRVGYQIIFPDIENSGDLQDNPQNFFTETVGL